MNNRFDYTIIEAINNAVRTVKASPLVLGGVTGSGGGAGGPIGGFVGQLPQTQVTYDLSEVESSGTPASGESLLDNLNHIRYRIGVVEAGLLTVDELDGSPSVSNVTSISFSGAIVSEISGGHALISISSSGGGSPVAVYDDSVPVASGIIILDFGENLYVTDLGSGHVLISGASTFSGDTSYIVHEDFSDICVGVTHYDTLHIIQSGSLEIYYNGLRQEPIVHYLEDFDGYGFTTLFTPGSGDALLADYLTPTSGFPTPSAGTTIIHSGGSDSSWGSITGTLSDQTDLSYSIIPEQGFMRNGKIERSVSSNNITVSIKTLSGNNPSAAEPVYVRIGNFVRTITSALSITKIAGTSWFNSGSSELQTFEIDYFVYLGYNSTDGVVIGFARFSHSRVYGDFSTTSTNEKYCAISTITNAASTDEYEVVGRFNATLSASPYNWSVPATSIIISKPMFDTRWLTWAPQIQSDSMTWSSVTLWVRKYKISYGELKFHTFVSGTTGGTATNALTISAPYDSINHEGQVIDATGSVGATGSGQESAIVSYVDNISIYRYNNSNYTLGANRWVSIFGTFSLT